MNDSAKTRDRYLYLAEHPEIFEAIGDAVDDPLRVQKSLRSRFPADVVRLALTVYELRRKAARKFPDADRMWFDRVRLEQATAWPVAVHKARRFRGECFDLCCGAGGDALALAEYGSVIAVDSDPVACVLAELNAKALGLSDRIHVEQAGVEELRERTGLLHIDPDRRAGASKRTVRVEDYVPGLATLQQLSREFRGGAIKLSPAANFGGKFEEVEIELVSLNGECKEATIWFGSLGEPNLWRATSLPSGETLAGDPLGVEPVLGCTAGYVFDPDPAIVRAGLVDLLCHENGLQRLDAAEEYLTGDKLVLTPFAQPFRVLAELPNNERVLRKYLAEEGVGRLEVKARRLPIDVEKLRRRLLPLPGDRSATVIFARVAGKARILITERILPA